jgi:hypothetical protein
MTQTVNNRTAFRKEMFCSGTHTRQAETEFLYVLQVVTVKGYISPPSKGQFPSPLNPIHSNLICFRFIDHNVSILCSCISGCISLWLVEQKLFIRFLFFQWIVVLRIPFIVRVSILSCWTMLTKIFVVFFPQSSLCCLLYSAGTLISSSPVKPNRAKLAEMLQRRTHLLTPLCNFFVALHESSSEFLSHVWIDWWTSSCNSKCCERVVWKVLCHFSLNRW